MLSEGREGAVCRVVETTFSGSVGNVWDCGKNGWQKRCYQGTIKLVLEGGPAALGGEWVNREELEWVVLGSDCALAWTCTQMMEGQMASWALEVHHSVCSKLWVKGYEEKGQKKATCPVRWKMTQPLNRIKESEFGGKVMRTLDMGCSLWLHL